MGAGTGSRRRRGGGCPRRAAPDRGRRLPGRYRRLPGGPWIVALDPLSAWFLLLIALVGAATAVYGVTYLAAERGHRPVAHAHVGIAVLLAAMMGVVVAQAAVLFLLAWEIMAVSAYFLIVYEGERAEVARAGLLYLALTHVGTLALFAMFLAWRSPGGDLTFASLAATPAAPAVILLLALIGFGVKAGIVPLHFWLPGAHAAAPSHVSALLSGVMIKTGIYGLLRVMSLLGVVPAWWGWTLLGLGLVSGVLGVLWALAQHDLKRVLAYSSVENVGIILLGMGTGVLGMTYRQPVLAVLGLGGAMLHALNHSLFKSLLFLGAGSIVRATGTRTLDELGGVGRWMPLTATAFLLGSVAIVGLPPLNGFVSEWVVVQALLRTGMTAGAGQLAVFAAAGLGLIAALALACFARVFGVVFLGQARSERPLPVEAGAGMLVPMAVLGAGCLMLGFAPVLAVRPLAGVVAVIFPPAATVAPRESGLAGAAAISGLAVATIALLVVAGVVRAALGSRRAPGRGLTWGCGYARPTSRMQYTGSSFGSPILAAFGSPVRPKIRRTETSFATEPEDRVVDRLLGPAWRRLKAAATTLRPLQQGRVTTYLQYIVLTVVLLLLALVASVARRA